MRSLARSFRPRLELLETRLAPANTPSLPVPALSSLPGAPATVYLDFNGHFDASWGSSNNVDTPPFDTNGNVNQLSANEITQIQAIWRYVAEDFAPFNINVTTVEPASFAKGKALRVAIGGDGAWTGAQIGGIAFIDSFATGTGVTPTCFAFSVGFGNNIKGIADVSSHEAGHMFGLEHQSEYNAAGTVVAVYYAGLSDGTAPIMGNSYSSPRSRWWNGTSTSNTTIQNDLTVIGKAANGFGLRSDDHGGTAASATELGGGNKKSKTIKVNETGLIGQMNDADWFKFVAKEGPITFTADVPDPYNNLDVMIELRDAGGKLVTSVNPGTSFDATLNYNIKKAGTYYVVVASGGPSSAATPNNQGINIGTYTLTGSYTPISGPFKIYSPTRWTFDPSTGITSGYVTISKAPFSAKAPITLQIKLPDPSIQWISPNAVQNGDTVIVTLNEDLKAGKSTRFFVELYNPRDIPLGNFFIGLVVKLG